MLKGIMLCNAWLVVSMSAQPSNFYAKLKQERSALLQKRKDGTLRHFEAGTKTLVQRLTRHLALFSIHQSKLLRFCVRPGDEQLVARRNQARGSQTEVR